MGFYNLKGDLKKIKTLCWFFQLQLNFQCGEDPFSMPVHSTKWGRGGAFALCSAS